MDGPDEFLIDSREPALRRLPSVDRVLRHEGVARLVDEHGRSFVTAQLRALLADLRARTGTGEPPAEALDDAALARALSERCARRLAPKLRSVLNLSGVVIHTNLGRAVLAQPALQQVLHTVSGACNLEYDLDTGRRGERDSLVEGLLAELTGAEAATVVNNNAAAVLLTIAAFARGREVVVSRGELVEIGGAFRMPEIMECAGARMVEVGTTNRTHPHDYERAIGRRTALLMKVHTSNYRVQGFTASVDEATLARIAHAHGLALASDLGSGALVDLSSYGLPREPQPQPMLAAGCDVVTFSGDKLLGGPQAGLIVGTRAAVGKIRRHPLKRALRLSKLPLAMLEATLKLYLRPERLPIDLPTLRLLVRPLTAIRESAQALAPRFAEAVAPRYQASVVELASQIGSGSLPTETLPSAGLAIEPVRGFSSGIGSALEELAGVLRSLPTPVIGRVSQDRLLLDLRCLEDESALVALLPTLRERLAR